MNKPFFALLLLFPLLWFSCSGPRYPGPLSPEQALDSFRIREGFKIEIFATEPQVMDPVSMIFDARGNAYVVEMPDYPYKPEPGEAEGRIRMIRDTDGDGRVDASTIFADSLSEATSILPWKDGLLVTAAPDILYFKDTDGDHQADSKEVLFTGFFADNSEAQITNLRYSVDNWIYAANYGQPGEVKFTRRPEAPPLDMRGGDFRFRLDREQFELATGPTQFGHAIDDWGHRFMSHNTLHIRQAVIPRRYLERHDHLPSTSAIENINDHGLRMYQLTPAPYWRAERTKRRNKRYEEQNLDRTEHAKDHFTGASGATFYLGNEFPEAYYGNVFSGDVAGNLVHRDVLTLPEDSSVFIASRGEGEQDKEFLATTDSWFRPSNLTMGPNGDLYVIDMYRQHIETPLSIPEDLKADMDFYNGDQMGRIYRILPEDGSSNPWSLPDLTNKTSEELVAMLDNSNRWWRIQAQRLLLENQDQSVKPALKEMVTGNEDPRARLHALYVLKGMEALTADVVKKAMQDPHPGVRENGMILSEQFPGCKSLLLKAINDPSARVALQATLSLGAYSGRQVKKTLASVIREYGEDPWFRKAVLSAEAGSSLEFFERLLNEESFFKDIPSWKASLLEDFSYIMGSRNQETQINAFFNLLDQNDTEHPGPWQKAVVKGLSNGLKSHADEDAQLGKILEGIDTGDEEGVREGMQDLKMLYSK